MKPIMVIVIGLAVALGAAAAPTASADGKCVYVDPHEPVIVLDPGCVNNDETDDPSLPSPP